MKLYVSKQEYKSHFMDSNEIMSNKTQQEASK
jgi:hypothetical protein